MIQDISSDQIGMTETSGSLSRLVDYINSYFVLLQNMIVAMRAHLSSYMEELVRAREELNSHALARCLAEEYLEKDSVTDNRRDTTPNKGHFITSTCLNGGRLPGWTTTAKERYRAIEDRSCPAHRHLDLRDGKLRKE
ncbi:hypothetical protein T4A_2051, partial [Trichinella pseudospiralis]